MITIDAQEFTAIVMAVLVLGLVVGCWLATWLQDRAAVRWNRLERTGRLEKIEATASRLADRQRRGQEKDDGNKTVPFTPESVAMSRAYERVVSNGADRFMEANPGLTRKQAIARAQEALKTTGAFKLHGSDVPASGVGSIVDPGA